MVGERRFNFGSLADYPWPGPDRRKNFEMDNPSMPGGVKTFDWLGMAKSKNMFPTIVRVLYFLFNQIIPRSILNFFDWKT